ncbi:MAG: hypothetical protein KC964_03965 [Candidatus Omnitrophica bacterium]|nr:hypothetical protein [Candidatus Omnitrophota bacterium]
MNDFKVLDWLREVRDRNAEIESGMSKKERIERSREGAKALIEELRQTPGVVIHPAGEGWRRKLAPTHREQSS